jgi:hypothetical protein
MPRWEYKTVNLGETSRKARDIDLLADAGEDGRELVTITPNNIAYLKRPVDVPAAPPRARRTATRSPATSSSGRLTGRRWTFRRRASARPLCQSAGGSMQRAERAALAQHTRYAVDNPVHAP